MEMTKELSLNKIDKTVLKFFIESKRRYIPDVLPCNIEMSPFLKQLISNSVNETLNMIIDELNLNPELLGMKLKVDKKITRNSFKLGL